MSEDKEAEEIAGRLTKMERRAALCAADAPLVGYAKAGAALMNQGLLEIRPALVGWKPRRILTDIGRRVAAILRERNDHAV